MIYRHLLEAIKYASANITAPSWSRIEVRRKCRGRGAGHNGIPDTYDEDMDGDFYPEHGIRDVPILVLWRIGGCGGRESRQTMRAISARSDGHSEWFSARTAWNQLAQILEAIPLYLCERYPRLFPTLQFKVLFRKFTRILLRSNTARQRGHARQSARPSSPAANTKQH